jgi:hypothetical protein
VPTFIPGRELNAAFYREVVGPAVGDVPHGAAYLGWGSEVLGNDDPRSTDHGWGPRLQVFVAQDDVAAVAERVRGALPAEFLGWPVRFGWDDTPVSDHIEFTTLEAWLALRLGFDPRRGMSTVDWLAVPQQLLLEMVGGLVFHDDGEELQAVRQALSWYPDDVWLWLLACQWRRLEQEEAFVGRTAEVGDELGSRVVAARLARDVMRLCFLVERRYAPYSKWLGTEFAKLSAAADVGPALERALAAPDHPARELALADAYEAVARRHNALGVTDAVDPTVRPFHSRPFRVLHSERFVAACLARVADPGLRDLPLVGAIDQFVDSTDVLAYPARARRARALLAADDIAQS